MRVTEPTLVELFERNCERFRDRPLFGTKQNGTWSWLTYADVHERVARCRAGLAKLGVSAGDRVALISDNRVEWAVVCEATLGLGAAIVPMYQAQLPSDWQFILGDCGAKVAVCATRAIYDTIARARASLPSLERLVLLGGDPTDSSSYAALVTIGDEVPVRTPTPETIAAYIYTSGTTGKPKGVLLTHANVASNLAAVSERFPLEPDDSSLSFLPWTHAYGFVLELLYFMSQGCSIAINDALPNLIDNLAEVKPTVLVAVPRVFNRIYSTVNATLAERPGIIKKMFHDGIRNTVRKHHGERLGPLERLELSIDDRLLFRKIRERFGGRLRMVASGSASLSLEVAEFVDALGITVYEGYGLTETSPLVSLNSPGRQRLGSVGQVIPGVRVFIDPRPSSVPGEGEIVVYGPNVMKGYHNRPDENARSFTPDGGFRTGDLGYIDEDGYLFITGRIKEQYKLTNGKYVMPSPLEDRFKLSPYIANIFLHGANRPYNVALVVPDLKAIQHWAATEGLTVGDIARDERVRALIEREITEYGRDVPSYQIPRRIQIITEDFTTDNSLLTPTLKLKRHNVEARYASTFEALYAAGPPEREAHAHP